MDSQQLLARLHHFDTPSITNVVATYPEHPLCLGLYHPWNGRWYTDHSLRCMYPELGARVGHAVTCVYGLPDPSFKRLAALGQAGDAKTVRAAFTGSTYSRTPSSR